MCSNGVSGMDEVVGGGSGSGSCGVVKLGRWPAAPAAPAAAPAAPVTSSVKAPSTFAVLFPFGRIIDPDLDLDRVRVRVRV